MKRLFLFAGSIAGASILAASAASAQTSPPYVVIYRVGDGSGTLTSAGTDVFLDEYSLTGTLVSSFELPPTAAGANLPLVASGTAGSEGELTTSTNGQYVLVPGYDAAAGTASIAGTTSVVAPREVATVSASGALVQTTINNYSANNIRGAASADGTTIFTSGANTGILAVTSGASLTAGTVVTSTSINNRGVAIYNGQLFLGTGSGTTLRIASVGTGVSATAGQTATEVTGIPIGSGSTAVSGPYGFVGTILTAGGTTTDTFYVADNGNGTIEKFSLVGGSFTLMGTATLTGVTGLTGLTVGATEELFATTPTGLYSLVDASGAGGTLTATTTQIATAATNTAFRGDTLFASVLPGNVVPEPSTYALLTAGAALIFLFRRTRGVRA